MSEFSLGNRIPAHLEYFLKTAVVTQSFSHPISKNPIFISEIPKADKSHDKHSETEPAMKLITVGAFIHNDHQGKKILKKEGGTEKCGAMISSATTVK
jgi:hypothetical protein